MKKLKGIHDTFEELFGDRARSDSKFCIDLWSALANVEWRHESGESHGLTFRGAGSLVAGLLGKGDYMDWYCKGPYETVSNDIKKAMSKNGWTPYNIDNKKL